MAGQRELLQVNDIAGSGGASARTTTRQRHARWTFMKLK